jgi:hypothetical protein
MPDRGQQVGSQSWSGGSTQLLGASFEARDWFLGAQADGKIEGSNRKLAQIDALPVGTKRLKAKI